MLQLSSMYSFQVSTLASMRESTLTLSVNWSLKEPQKLNTPRGQTVTRVFTLPMIKRTLSFHKVNFYRPQRSCGRGYVFTGVCHSVNGGGVSASVHAGIPHPSPWEQTPPQSRPPREQTPPGSRLRHTLNEWPVRILLECILVTNIYTLIKVSVRLTDFFVMKR